jgi:lipopolysaccharide/colanic/teichoic acid biosynthesis glycosyltransferase
MILNKRLFDIAIATGLLIPAVPLVFLAALGIKLSSAGPVIFRADRVGRNGLPFSMLKLRTMHLRSQKGAAITAAQDTRVFGFGRLLRCLKIDELPQLWNIVKGDMSLVGPRPEDSSIVKNHYTDWMRETLDVRPGLTSPGALFGYVHGGAYIDEDDPEGSYIRSLMPVKLAVEKVYLERQSLVGDVLILWRTAVTVAMLAVGSSRLPAVPELKEAERFVDRGLIKCSPNAPIY